VEVELMQRGWPGAVVVMLGAAVGLVATPSAGIAGVRVGAQGGPVFATQVLFSEEGGESDDLDTGTRTSFSAGLVLDVDVGSRVWLRAAPGWIEKGSTIAFELFGEQQRGRFELGYVGLPVTVNVSLASGTVRPYVAGGLVVDYLARARTVALREDGEESEDAGEFFEDWDYGVTVGGGLEVAGERTRGFVEGRYTWGLSNLWTDEPGSTFKNRSWQLLGGVTFGL
jgi:hypothetical protein